MKVTIDEDFCAGHGACVVTCPEVFRIGSDGIAEVIGDDVEAAYHEAVRQAADECPTQAIDVAED